LRIFSEYLDFSAAARPSINPSGKSKAHVINKNRVSFWSSGQKQKN
jgi:hypothetical protein